MEIPKLTWIWDNFWEEFFFSNEDYEFYVIDTYGKVHFKKDLIIPLRDGTTQSGISGTDTTKV